MKFIPMLLVAGALAVAATTASAQTGVNPDRSSDVLNARVLEVLRARDTAPVVATVPVAAPAPVSVPQGTGMNLSGVYLGGFVSHNSQDSTDYQVGGVVGYQFHRNWAAEVTYDYNRVNDTTQGEMVMGNLVYSRQLGTTAITPYVLAGAGMGWNAQGERGTGDNLPLYNVGGGVRLNVVQNVGLDARYRHVGAFDSSLADSHQVVSGGVNIRF